MNRIRPVALPLLLLALLFAGACGDDAWNDLPFSVFDFVNRYYPSTEVESYNRDKTTGAQTVKIRNGATLVFDSNNQWTEINGNGATLPAMMLYDQLPGPLYNYLEEMEAVEGVYAIWRTSSGYTVRLLDSDVVYDYEKGITQNVTAP